MNFFKSILSIVALCAIGSVNAKGLKKGETPTTTPSTQSQPKPITNQPAQPKPIVKSQQPVQQSTAYNDILNTIKRTEPSANDYHVINEIMDEIKKKYQQSHQKLFEKLITVTLPLNKEMRTLIENNWDSLFKHEQQQLLQGLEQYNTSEYNKLLQEKTPLGQKIRSFLEEQSTSI